MGARRGGAGGRPLDAFAEATTPCPLDVRAIAEANAVQFGGLRAMRDDPVRARELPRWARERLVDLAAAEDGWARAAAGDTLVHGDVRADNVLLTHDRVVFVDWPWAARGAPWLDVVFMSRAR